LDILQAALVSPKTYAALNPSTQEYGPITLVYNATDSLRSSATVQRSVYITTNCPNGENLCPGDPPKCSRGGACVSDAAARVLGLSDSGSTLDGTQSSGLKVPASTYKPVLDLYPPKLTLLGYPPKHTAAFSAAGIIHITEHIAGDPYTDPGASAIDQVDGDLSHLVSASGLKAVMTQALSREPTPPDKPLIILYNIQDAAGNAAPQAVRRVNLICSGNAARCENKERPGVWYCSAIGSCIVPPPQLTMPASVQPANITLVGPPSISLNEMDSYIACPPGAPIGSVCDQGAIALDPTDGDVSSQIDACAPNARFEKYGLRACNLNTTVPGTYSVTFMYNDTAAGVSIIAVRTIAVLKQCSPSELRCSDLKCSSTGICENGEYKAPINIPPTISLISAASEIDAVVLIPKGWAFAACKGNSLGSPKQPCDPGGTVTDPEDGDLTDGIVTCPPMQCRPQGCPAHRYSVKGIKGCVDTTSARIGEEFVINYQVWDKGVPSKSTTASRVLRIVSPCATNEIFCDGLPTILQCGTLACGARASLVDNSDSLLPPELQLVTPLAAKSNELTVPCGLRPPMALEPCRGQASASPTMCGVDAVDPSRNSNVAVLRSNTILDASSNCTLAGAANGTCVMCPLGLIEHGKCPASSYKLVYSVLNSEGMPAIPLGLSLVLTQRMLYVETDARISVGVRSKAMAWTAESWAAKRNAILQGSAQTNAVLAALKEGFVDHAPRDGSLCGEILSNRNLVEVRINTSLAIVTEDRMNSVRGEGSTGTISYHGPLGITISAPEGVNASALPGPDLHNLEVCLRGVIVAMLASAPPPLPPPPLQQPSGPLPLPPHPPNLPPSTSPAHASTIPSPVTALPAPGASPLSIFNRFLTSLTPSTTLTEFTCDIVAFATATCERVNTLEISLDALSSALLTSMASVKASLPSISGTLSSISLLSQEVQLGIDVCELASNALTSIMELILDFFSFAIDVGITLNDSAVTEADTVGTISFTQCDRASQLLQKQLSGQPSSNASTRDSAAVSPFSSDGVITTATIKGFSVTRHALEGRRLCGLTLDQHESVIRGRTTTQSRRADEELVMEGGRNLLDTTGLSWNATAVCSFLLRACFCHSVVSNP
jgi:hypothetical protein